MKREESYPGDGDCDAYKAPTGSGVYPKADIRSMQRVFPGPPTVVGGADKVWELDLGAFPPLRSKVTRKWTRRRND